jgi:hypothetical protein
VAARTAVELCVLWAVHCHFDEAPLDAAPVDDESVAATVAAMVARSVALTVPEGGS